ncbi:hypothetical protein P152DRAFT_499158 [Eremomyces bilateralis CBS 781.70]|uniref:Uncharacterized protein n=1 Tax=Eremomyces bilateralis CBS 781.70 TaxID=1392243 RepID=A0A6G1GB20_9PEZI|nr:uncharacterized protein P152DRAFT_499158 [Eremomyces bilateralis CBS 781.70]KAF1815233.1 hypothetical protein P152DRAFT_499158 [Eremomyces bilateralis CBS 781.70]
MTPRFSSKSCEIWWCFMAASGSSSYLQRRYLAVHTTPGNPAPHLFFVVSFSNIIQTVRFMIYCNPRNLGSSPVLVATMGMGHLNGFGIRASVGGDAYGSKTKECAN